MNTDNAQETASDHTLVEPNVGLEKRKIGGWLVLLIIGLAFLTPGAAQTNISETNRSYREYLIRFPSLETAIQIHNVLLWGVIIISIYSAYMLAFKRPAAVLFAKRGLILMALFGIAANFSLLSEDSGRCRL
jgi:hypothetical protein